MLTRVNHTLVFYSVYRDTHTHWVVLYITCTIMQKHWAWACYSTVPPSQPATGCWATQNMKQAKQFRLGGNHLDWGEIISNRIGKDWFTRSATSHYTMTRRG